MTGMFLDGNDLKSMELFIDKAEKLRYNSFTKKITSEGFGITISAKKDGNVNVKQKFPTNESIDAFVLTLRFFIQDNESSSFGNLAKIYSKLPDHCKEKKEFLRTRKELNDYLDLPDKSLNITENGKTITNNEIFNTFVYGGLAHANVKHKKKYDEWMTNPLSPLAGPILQQEFINIMSNILNVIYYIQELNESLIIDDIYFK